MLATDGEGECQVGIKSWYADNRKHAPYLARYGTHSIDRGTYKHDVPGKLGFVTKDVAGAIATYEPGGDMGARSTLTRVAAGAIIAGPVGAVVGGMFKKERGRGYVTVEFPDGDVVVVDGPIKDEPKMRQFAAKVNAAASFYAE
ncbi:hypothetical protein [Microbacterium sp. ZXX196]|uniref:hypothetical protein n=1 Tax=Microbacterium sp. ZXX196 TaxID=2609291 RepID=UPI0012B98C86|nr:hypothetical protein [Microbacterium sp. ZXX196]MTE24825.1 hypothetical protein [Microbacterium sp. ZXX196]